MSQASRTLVGDRKHHRSVPGARSDRDRDHVAEADPSGDTGTRFEPRRWWSGEGPGGGGDRRFSRSPGREEGGAKPVQGGSLAGPQLSDQVVRQPANLARFVLQHPPNGAPPLLGPRPSHELNLRLGRQPGGARPAGRRRSAAVADPEDRPPAPRRESRRGHMGHLPDGRRTRRFIEPPFRGLDRGLAGRGPHPAGAGRRATGDTDVLRLDAAGGHRPVRGCDIRRSRPVIGATHTYGSGSPDPPDPL